jgi:hypothetical protein
VNVRFLSLTEQEIDEAVAGFDEQVEGRGLSSWMNWLVLFAAVKAYPFASTERTRYSKMFVRAFFLLIDIRIEEQTIVVIAVAQYRRRPRYWVERVESD